ncbi:MAG: hypothetical protein AAGI53_07380 [Planctomycetota bacterium]
MTHADPTTRPTHTEPRRSDARSGSWSGSWSSRWAASTIAVAITSAAGAPAELSGAAPVYLLDRGLSERSAWLVSLDAESTVVQDAQGRRVSARTEGFLAVFARPESKADSGDERATPFGLGGDGPETASLWTLTLTDGQALLGAPSSPTEADTLAFRSELLGDIVVDLERVATLTRSESAVLEESGEDVLELVNGDRVRGFVLDIDAQNISVERSDGSLAVFELSVIEGVQLANPPEPNGRPLVGLATGETLAAMPSPPGPGSDRCVLVIPDLLAGDTPANRSTGGPVNGPLSGPSSISDTALPSVCIDPVNIRSIVLPTRHVEPLAAPGRIAAAPSRRRTNPPVVEPSSQSRLAPSVYLPGPMNATWTLSPDASAIAFDARLGATLAAETAPPGPWADAILRVQVRSETGRTTIAEHRLNADQAYVRVTAPLPNAGTDGRELIIELDAASYGPIQDPLLLVRPVVISPR